LVLARSGWSKQGGFELYLLDATRGTDLWELVKAAGRPYGIGPGAPSDVERVESGLLSYGGDCRHLSQPANPFEVGLGHLIDLDSGIDFIGREALTAIKRKGAVRRRVGLFIEGPPLAFPGHPVAIRHDGERVGTISEAVFSPRLKRNIAVGFLASRLSNETQGLSVDLGDGARGLQVTGLPFIPS